MRSDEFIKTILKTTDEQVLGSLRNDIPLGLDVVDKVALAKNGIGGVAFNHTCVAGVKRTEFIRRLLITLSCLYGKDEACFFVVSPKEEYGELLKLNNIDVTVPYIRTKADLESVKDTLLQLLLLREGMAGCPKLFFVVDGIEKLEDCNRNGDLEEYREFSDALLHKKDVEFITGVDLTASIFNGAPGAFVGIGNCLVATKEEGKADLSYVNMDVTLSQPLLIRFPSEPSMTETIVFLNSLDKE